MAIPVTVLVAPGPDVTRQTPTSAAGPGVSVRGMDGALLMADQDVPQIASEQFVINVDDGTAGIAEDGIHPLFFQCFQ